MAGHKIRIDKWLWSVRIFKSRSKASTACKSGKVRSGEQVLKPSSLIVPGQIIDLKKDGFNLSYKVIKLIEKRVSSPLAVVCYENLTPEEELNKFKDWFIGKGPSERRERGTGRPTKRERREIESFKEEIYLDDWFDSE
ncbi:MAG: RNA-binding S4 domain-containing protein [Bacteroidia bacterium]|nr:RNA-binding S4 domain-containing protein [Bacteroidia bacterium]